MVSTGTTVLIELFDYPSIADPPMPSWDAFGSDAMTDCSPGGADKAAIGMPNELETPTRTAAQETKAEELKQSFESGRLRGFEDGRAAEREAAAALAKTLETRWIEQSARLVAGFDAQRTQYFETVEPEVVKLSLAVAARILRRESQMDPLLLSGAVRVALGQLSSATQVRLRVPAADVDLWRETIAHLPNLCVKPAIVADDEMSLGECALESEFGSADLGIASHLAEIERGFFDRTGADRAGAGAIAVTKDMLR